MRANAVTYNAAIGICGAARRWALALGLLAAAGGAGTSRCLGFRVQQIHGTSRLYIFNVIDHMCIYYIICAHLAQRRHLRRRGDRLREGPAVAAGPLPPGRGSGGPACLTLLVQRRCSSRVTNNAANSISRIRQVINP